MNLTRHTQSALHPSCARRTAHGRPPAGVVAIWARMLAMLLLAPVVLALAGCEVMGFAAHMFAGGERARDVAARYTELDGRSVAVLVAADSHLMHAYPQAASAITRVVSRQIGEHVSDVRVKNPYDVIDYQRMHGHWYSVPYAELLAEMNVDRLVLIDLFEYRTHEPGNRHVFQGVATGNVLVIAADSDDPDNADFEEVIHVEFPEYGSKVGTVETQIDAQTVQIGLVQLFSRQTARLFHDHRIEP